MVLLMIWYQYLPDIRILMLPLFLGLALITALGAGIWLSAMNVKYRDFRYVVPFVVQFGLYISPVGFSSSVISEKWRFLYSLNPMVGVIDGFRWAILGGDIDLYLPGLISSILISIGMFILGVRFFRKTERTFADII
jgi:lipopolysaccharide transport system permease protein